MTKEEFVARFIAHMVKMVGREKFEDGSSVADYASDTAGTYFDYPDQREEGPEACAESDMDYWKYD